MNLFALIFILIVLIFIYVKINFKNVDIKNNFIRIISRVYLSKDNSIMILKVLEKYYLCSSTNNNFKIIEGLDEQEVLNHLKDKKTVLLKKE